MAKKIQLSIPEPCHEDWNSMSPSDKGRFCASCQKQVIDFSNMTDREVAKFFKKPSIGSVCGRFMNDQLNRELELPRKRIPWVKYFFQIALPAFLASAKASAQGNVKVDQDKRATISAMRTVGDTVITTKQNKSVSKICQPVIMGDIDSVISKEDEAIKFQAKPDLKDTVILPEVIVVSTGYTRKSSFITGSITQVDAKQLEAQLTGVLGGTIAGTIVEKEDSLIKKVINFFSRSFKAYPNPVKSGTSLNIEWTQTETGNYFMQLVSQGGQLVHSRKLWIDAEAKVLSLEVPQVAAGTYFLRMTNSSTGKSFTEKVIIQSY